MKLRELPLVKGLSKGKLIGVFIFFIGLVIGVFLYVANRQPSAATESKTETNPQNYASNNSGADVSEIVGAGHRVASKALAVMKHAASGTAGAVNTATNDVAANQTQQQQKSQEEQELKNAMKAPLSSNQVKPQGADGSKNGGNASQPVSSADNSGLPKDDANQTSEKRAFIKSNANSLNSNVKNRIADYVLAFGSKIPAQVDQDINSDLPGQIYGHITRDVYDSRTHSVLLLPAGSNLVGTYDSSVAYGQERLLVAWQRINLPNGQFMDLPGIGGADSLGAGFGDKVDNHYDKIWGATILTSLLAAGAQLAQPQQSNALQSPGVGQTIGQSVGTQIAQTGTTLMNKNLNLQPTLHIRPGFEFTVEVNKDLVFPGAYTGNANK